MYTANTFFSALSKIYIGTDRMDISIPDKFYLDFIHRLHEDGSNFKIYTKNRYYFVRSNIQGSRISILYPKGKLSNSWKCERAYIRIYNPSIAVQQYIKKTLINIANLYFLPLTSIKIKQYEVKYDFYSNASEVLDKNIDIEKMKKFLKKHLVLRYARSNSYSIIGSTYYIGRSGDVRKGKFGIRIYIKKNKYNPESTFLRLEFQYNDLYFYTKKITINNLPLSPLSFESYKHSEIYDYLSQDGLKNIAKAIFKKNGNSISDKRHYKIMLSDKITELNFMIIQKANRQYRRVHDQFTTINDLKKKYKFTMNHKQYFRPMNEVKQLILCHADISYDEDLCSKRMLLCHC